MFERPVKFPAVRKRLIILALDFIRMSIHSLTKGSRAWVQITGIV